MWEILDKRLNILFLCIVNSCRSQIAEAGVDISHHKSQLGDKFIDELWDFSLPFAVMIM